MLLIAYGNESQDRYWKRCLDEEFSYAYYYFTKEQTPYLVDSLEDVKTDVTGNKFIVYLNSEAYKRLKYNPSTFIDEYCGVKIEYRKK